MSMLRVLRGDCIDVMRAMPAESINAVVCDPPYGLEFMGKDWDRPWAVTPTAGVGYAGRETNLTLPSHRDNRNANCTACGGRQRGAKRCTCLTPSWDREPSTDMREFQRWTEAWAREALRVLSPGGHLVAFGGSRTYHRLAAGVEDAGFEIRDQLQWLYGSGFPKSHNLPGGLGTALKPAHEPIVLARKPLSGTVAATVQRHGTGALNIDGCRIGTILDDDLPAGATAEDFPGTGRWPANVILDPDAALILDAQTGTLSSGSRDEGEYDTLGTQGILGAGKAITLPAIDGDSGGASRFYYVAKPDKAERSAGLDGRNVHPTVKPIDLMRWLVRLVTPPGGTVLDPFAGSGTTGCACAIEGVAFVGIERDAEYLSIARDRIRHHAGILGDCSMLDDDEFEEEAA